MLTPENRERRLFVRGVAHITSISGKYGSLHSLTEDLASDLNAMKHGGAFLPGETELLPLLIPANDEYNKLGLGPKSEALFSDMNPILKKVINEALRDAQRKRLTTVQLVRESRCFETNPCVYRTAFQEVHCSKKQFLYIMLRPLI